LLCAIRLHVEGTVEIAVYCILLYLSQDQSGRTTLCQLHDDVTVTNTVKSLCCL